MGLVKDLRICQFLVLYKIHQEKLFGYIFVKQHYHYYGDDDDDDDDVFNKPLREFLYTLFLCSSFFNYDCTANGTNYKDNIE